MSEARRPFDRFDLPIAQASGRADKLSGRGMAYERLRAIRARLGDGGEGR